MWIILISTLFFMPVCQCKLHYEKEASAKLDEETAAYWKPWSSWSECSRTCDGGASFQYRQCIEKGFCSGQKIRYRLCNIQACPVDTVDFRSQQCAAYNNIRYKARIYRWMPFIDPKKPCALVCQSEDGKIVREVAASVLDGTRCRSGSLDMCINGACTPVGCDLLLNSSLKLDACGICGGDGSKCGKPASYVWKEMGYSDCSRSCGGGYQKTQVHCLNSQTGGRTTDQSCDAEKRPATQMRECHKVPCQPILHNSVKYHPEEYQWATDSWGPCTRECDGGKQARGVSCLQILHNGTKQLVGDYKCTKHTQPPSERQCNAHQCPQWQTSSWSVCSASCGRGSQVRTVKCVDHKGFDRNVCDGSRKPAEKKACKSSEHCNDPPLDKVTMDDQAYSEQALPLLAPQSWANHIIQPEVDEASKYEDTPMYSVGAWSECSVTCGHGYRQRSVECKLYIKFSVKLVQLPDSECNDPRPVDREPCSRRLCDTAEKAAGNVTAVENKYKSEAEMTVAEGVEVTYSWHYEGLTACTKTCLGGVRHSIVRCVRDHDQSPVDEKHCKALRRPPELKQPCNDTPCPPRWNTSTFTPCSRTCGGGTQTRTVQCIQELGPLSSDLLPLPESSCSYPPPRTQVSCANLDCQPEWDAGTYGPCSRTCGKGTMERSVVCRQRMASGDVQDFNAANAPCSKQRPAIRKSCTLRPCSAEEALTRKAHTGDTKQPVTLNMSKAKTKASKVKVGGTSGSAVLYEGTDLRLKCPVFGPPGTRPTVAWIKDGKPVPHSKNTKAHIKMSALGAIKIRSLRKSDAGTYTCIAGKVRETIQLTVINRSATIPTKSTSNSDPLFIGNTGNTIQRFYANSTDALRILQTVSQKTTPFSNALFEEHEEEESATKGFKTTSVPPEANEEVEEDVDRLISSIMDRFQQERGSALQVTDLSIQDSAGKRGFVLENGSEQRILMVEWIVGSWSNCSQICGTNTDKLRSVECQVKLNEERQVADSSICLLAGLRKLPATVEECGERSVCPEWQTGPWEECDNSGCFAMNTAIQSRNVSCGFANGSIVSSNLCWAENAPRERRDCVNHKCKAVWTTGLWSECTATCGNSGMKSRILRCVWYGTSNPAGNMCRSLPRPAVQEVCQDLAKCDDSQPYESQCRDHFKYCNYANSLKLCRQKAYRLRCCKTCNAHQTTNA